jgi:hypothetical protein
VRARATLRLPVSQSVRFGVKPPLGLMTILHINVLCESLCLPIFEHPLRRQSGSVLCQLQLVFCRPISCKNFPHIQNADSPGLVRWGSEVHSTHTHTHTRTRARAHAHTRSVWSLEPSGQPNFDSTSSWYLS